MGPGIRLGLERRHDIHGDRVRAVRMGERRPPSLGHQPEPNRPATLLLSSVQWLCRLRMTLGHVGRLNRFWMPSIQRRQCLLYRVEIQTPVGSSDSRQATANLIGCPGDSVSSQARQAEPVTLA